MLPCGRRVHLHKSASFETIFEQIQTNHKNDAENDPNIIGKSIFGKHRTTLPNIFKHFKSWLPIGSYLLATFLLQRVFLAAWFLEPLRGHPLDRLGPPQGHP